MAQQENAVGKASAPRGLTRWLLGCGISSSVLFVAMLVIPPTCTGSSAASTTVNELSAIGAPVRYLWIWPGYLWTSLYVAFGIGVWRVGYSRPLRALGIVVVIAGVLAAVWPPMHRHEIIAAWGGELTDTLHVVWLVVNGLLTLLAMRFGAAALGELFHRYSIVTMLIVIGAGAMASLELPDLLSDRPTPWIGMWERVSIAAWLFWVMVLAIALRRRPMNPVVR